MSLMLSIEPGDIIAKKYRVVKKIGAGSFGTIFFCKLRLRTLIYVP